MVGAGWLIQGDALVRGGLASLGMTKWVLSRSVEIAELV
jgi:hypothetical protein